MTLRLGSLKTRTATVNAAAVAVVLIANGAYLVASERKNVAELRRTMEEHALLFARTSRAPLVALFDQYFETDPERFHAMVKTHMSVEPTLERILLASPEGEVLFDSAKPPAPSPPPPPSRAGGKQIEAPPLPLEPGASPHSGASEQTAAPPASTAPIQEPERRAALRSRAISERTTRDDQGNDGLEIVVPHPALPDRHRLSLLFEFSFKSLTPMMRRRIANTVLLVLASIVAAALVSISLASRITRPIEELTKGALEIGEGNFDRQLTVGGGNDEIRMLAETFSQMAGRLKENIAQLEDSNRRLAGLNEDLKELDRVKSDLLANVSHELRTPLTAIKGYTDYILDGKLGSIGEKQERGLLVIQRNLERLSRSINALLDFSTMDVGRISLNLQPLALPQLVDQIHQTLRSELERKQLRFVVELEPGLPHVIADRDKLAQVLENLVINAIKFTPTQGVIEVKAARDDSRGPKAVEVVVRDSGIGIPQDQVGRIFNRFHQVDSSTTRRFGGVGLGLAIVKSILDAHGASIKVESEEGRGTAFRFWLPAIEREDAQTLPGYS